MKNNLRTFLILAFLFLVGFVGFKIVRYSLARLTNSHQTKSFNLVTPKLSTDDLDTKDVQEIVKNYILDNPEVLLQSLENFQASRVEKQNEKIALKITSFVGSMLCAGLFTILALLMLPTAINGGIPTFIPWLAQTFLQLVLLSIIMVGQNLQQRHAELVAEEDFKIDLQTDKDIKEIKWMINKLLKK